MLAAFVTFSFTQTQNSQQQATPEVSEEMSISPAYEIGSPSIPEGLKFAGEDVPLDNPAVREKLDRELLVNTYWQSSTILQIKRSKRVFEIIEPILKANGVPEDFKYLAVAESGLVENAVSSSGARGIWQFMKATGKKYGLESTITVEERYNIEKSTKAACKYLKHAYDETGNWALAAAAYNRGLNGILVAMNKQQVKSYYDLYLNRETGRYVYRILALKTILSNPKAYGFQIEDNEYYTYSEFYTVTVDTTVNDLSKFAQDYGTTYLGLRTLNPWMISYSLQNKSGKKYTVKVPYRQAEQGIDQKP